MNISNIKKIKINITKKNIIYLVKDGYKDIREIDICFKGKKYILR